MGAAPSVDMFVREAGEDLAHLHLQDTDGHADRHHVGELEFALKPKGFGQAGQFHFRVDGPAVNYFAQFLGDGFHVESSADLKQWRDVDLLKSTDGETVFEDTGDATRCALALGRCVLRLTGEGRSPARRRRPVDCHA